LFALVLLVSPVGCGGGTAKSVDVTAGVVVPPTTHVSDPDTRDALVAYDPQGGSLRFARQTPTLAAARVGHVLVSEPSAAAPAGYLRRITAIRQMGAGGEVILETTQAKLTDAIERGALHARADLTADQVARTVIHVDGVTIEAAVGPDEPPDGGIDAGRDVDASPFSGLIEGAALSVGRGYAFDMRFNRVFAVKPGAGSSGQVTIDGSVHFGASFGMDVEISWFSLDSFEAKAGFRHDANLRLSGEAQGALGDGLNVATQYYTPLTFLIGFVPVIVVPRVDLFVTASGQVEAKVDFEAKELVVAQVGARWTDDDGWRDISDFGVAGDVRPPAFKGGLRARAGLRSSMGLKVYDVAGPELGLEGGLELDGQIPRNPIWIVNAFLRGTLSLEAELPVVGTIADYTTTLFDLTRELARSSNATPTLDLTARALPDPGVFPAGSPRTVDLRVPVDLRPGCPGVLGGGLYFVASDLEDGCPSVGVFSDRDGFLSSTFTFTTTGRRQLTVTARDSQGASVNRTFSLNVINTSPMVTLVSAGVPRQGQPFAIAAQVRDPNEADPAKLCASTTWVVEAPDAASVSTGCLQTVTFGVTGTRTVRATTRDDEGGETTEAVTLTVLEPPVNPHPLITSTAVSSRELKASGGAEFCVARAVPLGETIDLRQKGCEIVAGPAPPPRFYAGAAIENPTNEALILEWKLLANGKLLYGSAQKLFELHDYANTAEVTEPCTVTLKVIAPEPSRTKEAVTWTGRCKYNSYQLN
jgi:hypothetical protein